jgi:hypothetical protein
MPLIILYVMLCSPLKLSFFAPPPTTSPLGVLGWPEDHSARAFFLSNLFILFLFGRLLGSFRNPTWAFGGAVDWMIVMC